MIVIVAVILRTLCRKSRRRLPAVCRLLLEELFYSKARRIGRNELGLALLVVCEEKSLHTFDVLIV